MCAHRNVLFVISYMLIVETLNISFPKNSVLSILITNND